MSSDNAEEMQADDNSEYARFTSVRSMAKQFDDGTEFPDESLDHVPYKYDDALKYRFPQQKNYVAAHNYIPAPAVVDQNKRDGDGQERSFQKFNYSQPPFNKNLGQRSSMPKAPSWRDKVSGQSPYGTYGRGRGSVANAVNRIANGANSRTRDAASYSNAGGHNVGLMSRTRGQDSGVSRSGGFMLPVYTYDDEKALLEALQDGTYGLTAASDAATTGVIRAAGNRAAGVPDTSGAMYNYQSLHPSAITAATGEKAYFNMNPRIYDYKENTYQPIALDSELLRVEKKRLHSMGLSNADIA